MRSGTNERLREATGSALSELPDGLAHPSLQFNGPLFHFTRRHRQSHLGETLSRRSSPPSTLHSRSPLMISSPNRRHFQQFGRFRRELRATQTIPPRSRRSSTAPGKPTSPRSDPSPPPGQQPRRGPNARPISRLRQGLGEWPPAPPVRFLRSARAFLTLLSLSPFLRESVGAVFGLPVGVLATWIAAYEHLWWAGQSCCGRARSFVVVLGYTHHAVGFVS